MLPPALSSDCWKGAVEQRALTRHRAQVQRNGSWALPGPWLFTATEGELNLESPRWVVPTLSGPKERGEGWGVGGSALTAVEANHAAEVGVGGLPLDAQRILVAHGCQVVIHHLQWTLRRVQPPIKRQTVIRETPHRHI